MAGFEELIRKALTKQGDASVEQRSAIYQSSRQALQRMVAQNANLTDEMAKIQAQKLEEAIVAVEASYGKVGKSDKLEPAVDWPLETPIEQPRPVEGPFEPQRAVSPKQQGAVSPKRHEAVPSEQQGAEQKKAAPPLMAEAQWQEPQQHKNPEPHENMVQEPAISVQPVGVPFEPSVEAVTGHGGRQEPVVSTPSLDPDREDGSAQIGAAVPLNEKGYPATYRGTVRQERKPYAKMLLWVIILAGLGVAVWWAITFGPALLKRQLDGSVPNPPAPYEGESFVPDGHKDWINVFSAADNSQNIVTDEGSKAEIVSDGGRSFVRLTSLAGGQAGAKQNRVLIKIPKGIMESIKGRAASFEIFVRAQKGQDVTEEHEFAVFCEFAAMGNCGRVRFKAKDKVEAIVFGVLINDINLEYNEEAYLAFDTDMKSKGRSIDLYSIRVRQDG